MSKFTNSPHYKAPNRRDPERKLRRELGRELKKIADDLHPAATSETPAKHDEPKGAA